jgi:hypothetical protein
MILIVDCEVSFINRVKGYLIRLKTSITRKVQDIDNLKAQKVHNIDYPISV